MVRLMQLRDLLNTCQNQFIGLLGKDPNFEVKICFQQDEKTYTIKGDYLQDQKYLDDYRHREVRYWEMINLSKIEVEIDGFSDE